LGRAPQDGKEEFSKGDKVYHRSAKKEGDTPPCHVHATSHHRRARRICGERQSLAGTGTISFKSQKTGNSDKYGSRNLMWQTGERGHRLKKNRGKKGRGEFTDSGRQRGTSKRIGETMIGCGGILRRTYHLRESQRDPGKKKREETGLPHNQTEDEMSFTLEKSFLLYRRVWGVGGSPEPGNLVGRFIEGRVRKKTSGVSVSDLSLRGD